MFSSAGAVLCSTFCGAGPAMQGSAAAMAQAAPKPANL